MEQLERGLSVVKEALGSLDNQEEFHPPTLPNDWPELSCHHCSGPLEGAFHMQCYHCVEPSPYRLCLHCVKDEMHAHSHHGGGCVRDEKMSVKQARERGGACISNDKATKHSNTTAALVKSNEMK